ncbi:MAG: protein kinase [Alphaproteobacteria bacterium]|nr:protein kinase [Alphaproteobacteria bacterium]
MSAVEPLAQLLETAFSPDELRDWLHDREGFLFFQALPDEDARLYAEAAASLARRKRADAGFFEALREERPALGVAIAQVAGDFGLLLSGRAPAGAGLMRGEGLASPEPDFSDPGTQGLSIQLEALYDKREQAVIAGADAHDIDARIRELRRQVRHGPHLHAGEFLDDGRFKLIETIGRGGWGTVWKAYDRREHELVAVKVLHGHWSGERSRRERFARGAAAMAQLQHRGVVRVLREASEEGGFHFFVMELLRGGDLYRAVKAKAFDRARCLEAVLLVGEALSEAHERGLVHRDVKPHNILLDSRGRARLTDFDLVKDFDYSGSHTGSAMGTYRYAAPELLENAKDADARADIYGLGMTAAFCLARKDPPREAVNDPVGFVQTLEVGAGLRAALAQAVAYEADARWPSMAEFCAALELAKGDLERRPERSERLALLEALVARRDAGEAVDIELSEIVTELDGGWSLALAPGLRTLRALPPQPFGEVLSDEDHPRALLRFPAAQLAAPGALGARDEGAEALRRMTGDRDARRWIPDFEAQDPDASGWWFEWSGRTGAAPLAGAQAEDWREAVRWARRLCELAEDALSAGVEALPLRPGNLLRVGSGLILLHPFLPPASLIEPEDGDGEAGFAPPEGAGEAGYVYRIGRVLYATLLGQSPPLPGQGDPWQDDLQGFPEPVQQLVFKATALRPEDRYASLRALREALEDAARWSPPITERPQIPVETVPQTPAWWRQSRSWAAMLLVGVVAGGVWYQSAFHVDPSGDAFEDQIAAARVYVEEIEEAEQRAVDAESRRALLAQQAFALEAHLEAVKPIADEDADLAEVVSGAESRLLAVRVESHQLEEVAKTSLGFADSRRVAWQDLEREVQEEAEGAVALPAPKARPDSGFTPRPPAALAETLASPEGWPEMRVVEGAHTRRLDVPVSLPRFAVSASPITRGQYGELMWPRGSTMPNADEPVEDLSFCDALRFANRLSERDHRPPAYRGVPLQGCGAVERITVDRSGGGYRLLSWDEVEALRAVDGLDCVGAWVWGPPEDRARAWPAEEAADTPEGRLCVAGPPEAPAPTGPRTYVVQRGDTLGGLAFRFYGDASRWPEIKRANQDKLRGRSVLQAGMELVIPDE